MNILLALALVGSLSLSHASASEPVISYNAIAACVLEEDGYILCRNKVTDIYHAYYDTRGVAMCDYAYCVLDKNTNNTISCVGYDFYRQGVQSHEINPLQPPRDGNYQITTTKVRESIDGELMGYTLVINDLVETIIIAEEAVRSVSCKEPLRICLEFHGGNVACFGPPDVRILSPTGSFWWATACSLLSFFFCLGILRCCCTPCRPRPATSGFVCALFSASFTFAFFLHEKHLIVVAASFALGTVVCIETALITTLVVRLCSERTPPTKVTDHIGDAFDDETDTLTTTELTTTSQARMTV